MRITALLGLTGIGAALPKPFYEVDMSDDQKTRPELLPKEMVLAVLTRFSTRGSCASFRCVASANGVSRLGRDLAISSKAIMSANISRFQRVHMETGLLRFSTPFVD